jgi:AraC family transcriptional regulator, transcriptional activator of pobA
MASHRPIFSLSNAHAGTMADPLPLFHLYGDPPDDQAFDFIHVETISSRSSVYDWSIRAHRHRNLSQIFLIERGGGELMFEAEKLLFVAPAAILIPSAFAHAFQFMPHVTNGWVLTFTEDTAINRATEVFSSLCAFGKQPIVPIPDDTECARLSALCSNLYEELSFARNGYQLAMRGLLALVAASLLRLDAKRSLTGSAALHSAADTVRKLRALVDEHFRRDRSLGFYAEKLSMTNDRLNDHVKCATGISAGHLIRQRVLTEAKSQLVFTVQSIHNIAADLGFADSSHLSRFFRKHTGMTPHEFRERRGD